MQSKLKKKTDTCGDHYRILTGGRESGQCRGLFRAAVWGGAGTPGAPPGISGPFGHVVTGLRPVTAGQSPATTRASENHFEYSSRSRVCRLVIGTSRP